MLSLPAKSVIYLALILPNGTNRFLIGTVPDMWRGDLYKIMVNMKNKPTDLLEIWRS